MMAKEGNPDGAYVIDIRGGPAAPVSIRSVAPHGVPAHSAGTALVLPNGQVVVVGGMNDLHARFLRLAVPVYMAELWDPQDRDLHSARADSRRRGPTTVWRC